MEAWKEELAANELCHFGILGMKWGVRRYQNKDGTLTPAGRRRQAKEDRDEIINKSIDYGNEFEETPKGKKLLEKRMSTWDALLDNEDESKEDKLSDDFIKAEYDFLSNEGRYTANKLLADVGEERFSNFVDEFADRSHNHSSLQERVDAYVDWHYEVSSE